MGTLYLLLFSVCILSAVCIYLTAVFYFLRRRLAEQKQQTQYALQTLRYELLASVRPLEKEAYAALKGTETIVYDGRAGIGQNDFIGNNGRTWNYVAHEFGNEIGEGVHQIENNIITVKRFNTAGRYEILLKQFSFDGRRSDRIPSSTLQKQRRLRLSCEVKKGSASHVLRFVCKGESTKDVLDEKDLVIFNPQWQSVEVFFTIAATEDCIFRIDDLGVLEAPSHVQIRNLVLWEKI